MEAVGEHRMKHLCHAHGCRKAVPPKLLMCLKHWKMLPKNFQDDIWATYVPGQEIQKNPTKEYLKAQHRAVIMVLMKETGLYLEECAKVVLGL